MKLTKGATLLKSWLDADKARTMEALAAVLGVSRPAVSYWIQGVSRPEAHLRERLEIETGVPFGAWYTREEAVTAAGPKDSAKRKAS